MSFLSPIDVAKWSRGGWTPALPSAIHGVSNDTRTIRAGDLYIAIKGDRFDGHDFIKDAFLKGACGAVVNADLNLSAAQNAPLLRVEDTLQALWDIAAGYRERVAPEIVAITGSAGKSTVKEMTIQILSSMTPTAGTRGNWNNHIGLPLSILAMDQSARIGVYEIGANHPGELEPLCRLLKPTWGIVTNVGPVHTEFFGAVKAIAQEKATLLKHLPPDGAAVLNLDGGFVDLLRAATQAAVTTVSVRSAADYACVSRDASENRVTIREAMSGETFSFVAPAPGEHNIANAMLAIAVARGHGMNWTQIRDSIERYKPMPMRWQKQIIKGITTINDAYNANPLSMRASIQTFMDEKITGGKWLLLSGMLEIGAGEKEEHLALGESIAKGEWRGLIVVGPLGNLIADGAAEAGFDKGRIFQCETNEDAAKIALNNVVSGDAILLKASRRMRLEEVVEKVKERA